MSDYKRLTDEELADYTSRVLVQLEYPLSQETLSVIQEVLEYRTKIENGTLIELPKKCYRVVCVLGWEILEYAIVGIKYDPIEGIVSVKATRPYTIEYFTKENRYKGRVLGVDVFFTKPEAKAKLKSLKGEV